MKALDKLHEISGTLSRSDIEFPEKEAEFILRHCLKINLVDLYRDNPEISDSQAAVIHAMASRRAEREPLQYIIGNIDFLGLKIQVDRGVLIPRPETELMAELAIKAVRSQESGVKRGGRPAVNGQRITILDLCTGSGCLALVLAREFPEARVLGTDISETALNYARKNAAVNRIENVRFLKGHLFDPVKKDCRFDLIISNPPYIRTNDIQNLQPEIRDWEPVNALDGGTEGLDFYREIISLSPQFLSHDGILMLELGEGCSDAVYRMLKEEDYSGIEITKDYAGIKRIIHATWTK